MVDPNFILVGAGAPSPQDVPPVLPLLPLKEFVVFPYSIVPIIVTDQSAAKLLDEVSKGNRLLGIVARKGEHPDHAVAQDLYPFGTLCYLHRLVREKSGVTHVVIQGHERLKVDQVIAEEPYLRARVSAAPEVELDRSDVESEALLRNLIELFTKFIELGNHLPKELKATIQHLKDSRQLVYLIGSTLPFDTQVAQNILALDSVKEKIARVTELLSAEVEILEVGNRIRDQAQNELQKTQREYFLRQQLKAIQGELGETDEEKARITHFRSEIDKAQMPEEARKEAERELGRLEKLMPGSAEFPVIETYLEWLVELPWQKSTPDELDIQHAHEVLNEDHFGLESVKDRILEYLSVRKLKVERGGEVQGSKESSVRPERQGAILCFSGPPGVGKTSLGISIARALGRKFVRMSFGGLRDEAEIRGHRRTYVSAVPGRIIQSIRRAESKNPIIMLDEVDKVGADWRGDPSSALLEVLDPEQNREFRDNYLNVPFDLSEVLFICTANVLDTIPLPLRDRMEIIELSGYTEEEKFAIARQYLIPRQQRDNGLRLDELQLTDEALQSIVTGYTREAGVRNLERQIGKICRRVAIGIAKGELHSFIITPTLVEEWLGKPPFIHEAKERTEIPGVAIGLAVTAGGGDILFVEATKMPGRHGFIVTGQLGEVMKESAQAAFSLIRSRAEALHITNDFHEKNDLHVHIPAGAIPKDGPSAGVTIATALASLLTGRRVREEVGMTGEVTLRGKILPVGGIKEKVIAAHRAGLTTVILPSHNEKDLRDLPPSVKGLHFVLVDSIDEVLEVALEAEEFFLQQASSSAEVHRAVM